MATKFPLPLPARDPNSPTTYDWKLTQTAGGQDKVLCNRTTGECPTFQISLCQLLASYKEQVLEGRLCKEEGHHIYLCPDQGLEECRETFCDQWGCETMPHG